MARQIPSATLRIGSCGMLLALLALGFDGRAARAADYLCTWQVTTGSWTSTSDWAGCNGAYPNNGGGNTYEVTITGGSPTLSGFLIEIGSVSVPTGLTMSNSTLTVSGADLNVESSVSLTGSELDLENGSVVGMSNSGSLTTQEGAQPSQVLVGAGSDTGGDQLIVDGTLTNGGTLEIGNGNLTANDTVSAASLVNDSPYSVISIAGGTGTDTHTSSLLVNGAAGTDGSSTPDDALTGRISISGNGVLQFGSGAITAIGDSADSGSLTLDGAGAQVQIKGSTSNTNALTSLASVGGFYSAFDLEDGASLTTGNALTTNSTATVGVGAGGAGGALNVGGTLTNGYFLEIGASTQTADSTVTATGFANVDNGFVAIAGSSTNPGTLQVNGAATNAETVDIGGNSSLEVSAGNSYTQTGGTTTVTGTLGGSGAAVTISGGTLEGTGTVVGTATIGTGGTLAAGAPGSPSAAGTLTFDGSLDLDGTLTEIVNSGTAGTGYGVINVTGALTLGTSSTLDLAQLDTYDPATKTTLTIATAGAAVSGEFGSIVNNAFDGGDETWIVEYDHGGEDDIDLKAVATSSLSDVQNQLTLIDSSTSTPAVFVSQAGVASLQQGSELSASNVKSKGTFDLGNGASDTGSNKLSVSETLTQSGTMALLAQNDEVSARTFKNSGNTSLNGSSETVDVSRDLDNSGQFTVEPDSDHSSVTVDGKFTNSGTFALDGKHDRLTLKGAGTNSGTLTIGAGDSVTAKHGFTNASGATVVNDGDASWGGTFTNSGKYASDPSTNDFVNLLETSTGSVTAAAGDVYDISGNFINNSTQATEWDTSGATLEFSTGTEDSHDLELSVDELDEGATSKGYEDDFAWGTLDIDSGNSLDILGEAGATDPLALYVGALEGLDISGDEVTNITSDYFNIYYDPADDTALDGQIYTLEGGGALCPVGSSSCPQALPPPSAVPEPGSLALLAAGLLGLALTRRRRTADACGTASQGK